MYFDDAILEFGFDCKARKLSPKTIDIITFSEEEIRKLLNHFSGR